jgi:MFS family permease
VYRNYLLVVLLLVFAFNMADQMALSLLLQDIKRDLSLTDTQLGFLTGIAFALFYSTMGIPIARWADRGNRVAIVSITTALWSAALALCGLVGNFFQLLLVRIGVAVGEAGCIPPAHSLIAAYFSRAERPRAVAIYMMGGSLSALVSFPLAGWLNELYGWRATFMLLGVPGIVLSAVVWLTLRDPRRLASSDALNLPLASDTLPQPSLREVCAALWASTTFRDLLLTFSVVAFFSYGIGKWSAAFFIRSFGMHTGELGVWFGVINGLTGLLGMYVGGEWASRRAANNERLQLQAMALAFPCTGILWSGVFLSSTYPVAFAFLAVSAVATSIVSGPLFATVQTLVPERMRAMAIAILYLFANLIGMGLGPMAAGVLSDAFQPLFGGESLRYALLALCPGYLWGAWHAWRASKTVTRDIAAFAATSPRN